MGVKSTVSITRADALDFIDKARGGASDEELEAAMEALYGDKLLYNYSIVSSYDNSNISFDDVRWSHE